MICAASQSCLAMLVTHKLHDNMHKQLRWQKLQQQLAASGRIYREDAEEEGLQVQSLRDYVVAIPTMNAIHGQDTWGARHVSDAYADHSAWDVHTIIEILRKFFDASEGTSLPELAEYNWRLDKVTIAAAAPAALAAPAPPLPLPSPPFPAPLPLPPMPAPTPLLL